MATVAAVILALVVVTAGTIYSENLLAHPSTTTIMQTTTNALTVLRPITSTSIVTSTLMAIPDEVENTNYTTGLMLLMDLNSTEIVNLNSTESTSILVLISEYNWRPSSNNVTGENDWKILGLTLEQCQDGPMGIGIYPGYYTLQNVSGAGNPLFLSNDIFGCPSRPIPPGVLPYYDFYPQSETAQVEVGTSTYQYVSGGNTSIETVTQFTVAPEQIAASIVVNSYCCRQIPFANCSCEYMGNALFQAGNYTIVGGDEWGGLVLSHFNVVYGGLDQTISNSDSADTDQSGTS
jgi:hypothetical protein